MINLEQDFKQALKDKNEITTSALRNLKAEIKNTEIEKRRELTSEEVLEVVRKKVKQHKDSIESFKAGARADLLAREEGQMAVLLKYLPQQLTEEQVRAMVRNAIEKLQAKPSDFGKVMKEVLAEAKGQTDGNVVSKIVKEELK
jgi:hypothetical protein